MELVWELALALFAKARGFYDNVALTRTERIKLWFVNSSPIPSADERLLFMTNPNDKTDNSRRSFIKETGMIAAAASLATASAPRVHAAENNTIQVALVGCGGRGTGAATNALRVDNGPIKLVAMADVFPNKLSSSLAQLTKDSNEKLDVPEDRRFIGFDGYKKAMDLLKPGDVVILATPPAFRWVHFTYAIEKGLNVFMEKPVTVDGPGSRKMLELAQKSVEKNMKVGVGLMCRHCVARQELTRSHSSWRDWRYRADACLSHGRSNWFGRRAQEASGRIRADVPDQEFPCILVGQRWWLQRLPDSQHR